MLITFHTHIYYLPLLMPWKGSSGNLALTWHNAFLCINISKVLIYQTNYQNEITEKMYIVMVFVAELILA